MTTWQERFSEKFFGECDLILFRNNKESVNVFEMQQFIFEEIERAKEQGMNEYRLNVEAMVKDAKTEGWNEAVSFIGNLTWEECGKPDCPSKFDRYKTIFTEKLQSLKK